jgi:hypothetical protein
MRFRHADPAPVLAYLRANPVAIQILEWERERRAGGLAALMQQKPQPAGPAKPASIGDVEFMARRGPPSHAGFVLRYYFHVNSTVVGRPLSLVEAVEHVETSAVPGEFLLAGHPEAGLVSVSRERLPFQPGEPITWWGP